ncbi:MAG: hypothetical protein K8R23_10120 [Chthoniobacter sp.]|nr:hypothetical protein [Chthoniobacter sp.]
MPDDRPPVPARFRWLRGLGWVLGVVVLATGGWSVWSAYDYRAAVREARAAGFYFLESPSPFAAIREDWHAAFRFATWLEHSRRLELPDGTDLAPLRPLLLRLDPTRLDAWQCRNVDALRGLTRLQTLNLSDSEVKDLAPLASLTQLQVLGLTNSTNVADLAPLASLTQLKVLGLNGCTGVTDLAPLAGLTQLQELYLTDCRVVAELAPLASLSRLQQLYLGGCTRVTDIAPLAGLTQLQWLALSGCRGLSAEVVEAFKAKHPTATIFYP